MTPRDRLRDDMADCLRGFRLDCIAIKRDWHAEREIVRSGIAEILTLRLEAAYAPIFATLQGIERKFDVLAKALAYDAADHYGRKRWQ